MITPRLRSIVDCVNTKSVADIGCDHAYVPIALIDENRAKKVIACDINEGPVKIAQENIEKYNKQEFITTRIGAGLSPIEDGEVDTVIIAGMGGELIVSILSDDLMKAHNATLVLQPMNDQHTVRRFLINNGFEIIKEDIATEGFKVYNVIVAKSGEMEPFAKEIHYHIPPYLKGHEFYGALCNKKHRELLKVITGLEKAKEPDAEKLNEYRNLFKELESETEKSN